MRGREGSLDGAPRTMKPQALQGVSVERVTGIEPALSAWEADVLPLNYTRAVAVRTVVRGVRVPRARSLCLMSGRRPEPT